MDIRLSIRGCLPALPGVLQQVSIWQMPKLHEVCHVKFKGTNTAWLLIVCVLCSAVCPAENGTDRTQAQQQHDACDTHQGVALQLQPMSDGILNIRTQTAVRI
jgi:hypothetical protein